MSARPFAHSVPVVAAITLADGRCRGGHCSRGRLVTSAEIAKFNHIRILYIHACGVHRARVHAVTPQVVIYVYTTCITNVARTISKEPVRRATKCLTVPCPTVTSYFIMICTREDDFEKRSTRLAGFSSSAAGRRSFFSQ